MLLTLRPGSPVILPMMKLTRFLPLLLIVPALFFAGCASKKTQLRTVRVAVVDGYRTDDLLTSETTAKGWWWSRREYFRAANDEVIFADELARELRKMPELNVFSREDWRIFSAQKERLLQRADGSLSSTQRRFVLNRQDPLDYGESLSVDYVVRPVINDSFLTTNMFFRSWYSKLDTDIEVWDVMNRELVYVYKFKDTDALDSQLAMMKEASKAFTRKVKNKDPMDVWSD